MDEQRRGEHDSYSYTTNQIPAGSLALSKLQGDNGEIFKAYFYNAFRGLDVDADSKQYGQIRVNGTTKNEVIFYDSSWKNSNGNNAYSFEAIPQNGYEFVRWDYYRQKGPNSTDPNEWEKKNSIYTQTIEPDTFAVDRNEGWVLKAVFGPYHQPHWFTVSVSSNPNYSQGSLSSTYGNGNSIKKQGQYSDDTETVSSFRYGIKPEPKSGYKFAFFLYQDSSAVGGFRQINSITNTTIIPYNNVVIIAHFVPEC